MNAISHERPLTIVIMAIGGQGGGVLADWLVELGEKNGWYVQGTSVPGVAQRTGATIYYLEMIRSPGGATPVLSMMPTPGDVDVVVAAELMEAGRAIQRGLVSPDRTTLIASTHRALGILEKTTPGDGISDSGKVLDVARRKAKRLIAHDLQRLAEMNNSVISASLFGALAASGALPFSRASFEETIKAGGRGIAASLAAFNAGAEAVALNDVAPKPPEPILAKRPPVPAGGTERQRSEYARGVQRIASEFPLPARGMLGEGFRHVVDYQDTAYGHTYLDRVAEFAALDATNGGDRKAFVLTAEIAKYLANAMAYDDVIRVADLKTRASRFARFKREAGVNADQVVHVTEFMHPRVEEICGALPANLGRWVEARPRLTRAIDRVANKGRHVRTDSIRWFVLLYMLSGLRRVRRKLLRHTIEEAHISAWLETARRTATSNYDIAVEVVRCRRLIKGYSDTHARGEAKFDKVLAALPLLEHRADGADWLRRLREAALLDEKGVQLDGALRTVATL